MSTPTPTARQMAIEEIRTKLTRALDNGPERDVELFGSVLNALLAEEADKQPAAARDVLAERQRQVTAEEWSAEHDDEHDRGELARAAVCYADPANEERFSVPPKWPWDEKWWKPKDRRRDLVRAGALIIAEIERLDRLSGQAAAHSPPAAAMEAQGEAWRPIETAPKDCTMLSLLVRYDPDDMNDMNGNPLADASVAWTIGFNNFDHDGEDRWQLAGYEWSNDYFTEGHGEVIGWLPWVLPTPPSEATIPPVAEAAQGEESTQARDARLRREQQAAASKDLTPPEIPSPTPTSGEDLVERVARALVSAQYPDRPGMADRPIQTVDAGEQPFWRFREREAKAAITLIEAEATARERERCAKLCEDEGTKRNDRARNPWPGDATIGDFSQSMVQHAKALTANMLARDIRRNPPTQDGGAG